VKLAQLRLDNLKGQGLQDHRVLQSSSPRLIVRIDAQQGQIVPAGNPLVETVAADQLEIRLGVDPAKAEHLLVGQAVHLFPGDGSEAVTGKIRLITQSINPDTRLIDVIVTPDSRGALVLNSFMRAELITEEKKDALIAPHDAVLPEGDGYTLFTVKDGKAVKHTVTLGLQNNLQAAVSADDLHAGDTIVVQGNLELDDQMPVKVEGAPEETR
jgi:RND family efflux transporter MFP subunit